MPKIRNEAMVQNPMVKQSIPSFEAGYIFTFARILSQRKIRPCR
jgi:hypothetical protein